MNSFVSSIGTATPSHKYSQNELVEFMARAQGNLNGTQVKLKALYRASGIKHRYSVLSDYGCEPGNFSFYPNNQDLEPFPDTATRMDIYRKEALPLCLKAINECLGQACDFDNSTITHVITVSCTGFYAPGLDIDLIQSLGLNTNVHRTAINYMGCYAAISALRTADSIIKAAPHSNVLIVCVELCSIHFQKNDTIDNRLANALFGDGAAAVLVQGKNRGNVKYQLELLGFQSEVLPNGSGDMAWSVGNLGFEMKLSAYVPDIIKTGVRAFIQSLATKIHPQIGFEEVKYWAIHPGGKKILQTVEEELGLTREQNRFAYYVLNHFGNMSSPTVLFVINEIVKQISPADREEKICSMAFGPGLTLESALLKIKVYD